MRTYTFGKKSVVFVVHQMFFVMMVTCLFTMSHFFKVKYYAGALTNSVFAVIGLVGTFAALVYLTNTCGRKSKEDPTVYLHIIDKVYSDVLFMIFLLFVWIFSKMILHMQHLNFELAAELIANGTTAYLIDVIFLELYLSFVRRVKAGIFFQKTIGYIIYTFFLNRKESGKYVPLTEKGKQKYKIRHAVEAIAKGALDTNLNLEEFTGSEREIADAINHIRDGMAAEIVERVKNEQMKADLITNVSHDIKTPLTSIVNYVELLKRENLEDENAKYYIRVIDEKSQRLKQLTEDLVEASKISSGNVKLDMQKIDFVELLYQTGGEFNERFEARELTIVTKLPKQSVIIYADGRQLYRAIENLYTNAAKYALEKTRVYVELVIQEGQAIFSIRNICKNKISQEKIGEDLTERFVRGEESRTTEGSGLGLSIAKNLTQLMGGKFSLSVEEDLFIAKVSFKIA